MQTAIYETPLISIFACGFTEEDNNRYNFMFRNIANYCMSALTFGSSIEEIEETILRKYQTYFEDAELDLETPVKGNWPERQRAMRCNALR